MQRCSSAHLGCNEWLFDLLLPSYQYAAGPFSSDPVGSAVFEILWTFWHQLLCHINLNHQHVCIILSWVKQAVTMLVFCCRCSCSIMLSVQDRHEKWYSQEQDAVDAAESRVNWQMLLGGSVSSPANRSLSSSEWTPLALAAVLLAASSSLNRSEGSSLTRSGWETPRLTDTGLLCRQPPQRRAVITVCRPLGQGLISRLESCD